MRVCLVYVTAGSLEEAKDIGRALVTARLAACANIIPHMHSIYEWEGKLQEDTEAILIAKTTESLVGPVVEKVKALHSYTCPCVVSLPVSDGNREFLDWVAAQVG